MGLGPGPPRLSSWRRKIATSSSYLPTSKQAHVRAAETHNGVGSFLKTNTGPLTFASSPSEPVPSDKLSPGSSASPAPGPGLIGKC